MKNSSRRKINRTGKAKCELCPNTVFLEQHHIRGRKILKANHPSNLVNICPNCHTKVHYGEIVIEKWASTTSGRELIWHLKGEESFTGDDALPHMF